MVVLLYMYMLYKIKNNNNNNKTGKESQFIVSRVSERDRDFTSSS